ncbi:hexameric tyrosine-coordinated heme protein [Pseudomonas sp.]|uniref:hexameric tyrosine-coordinated heme protein n=1 Tax=Pseudomonas sp. TaxID=306 RepID=UPI003D0E185A
MSNLELVPGGSLITPDAESGRRLAVKMARLSIKYTQPDDAVRQRLRPIYAEDPAMLLQISHIIATEFAVIAAANGYWR